jgi:lanosterol synthase
MSKTQTATVTEANGTHKRGAQEELSGSRNGVRGATQNDKSTDKTRWRLKDERGVHTWHYLSEEEAKAWPQSTADKYFLGLDTVSCGRATTCTSCSQTSNRSIMQNLV